MYAKKNCQESFKVSSLSFFKIKNMLKVFILKVVSAYLGKIEKLVGMIRIE